MLALARPAAGASHKLLVLPVAGTADPATRMKLTTELAKVARSFGGGVVTAEATFDDTALAVGCDPRAPTCGDQVMAALGVDELVWGTATRDVSQTHLVVRRAAKGGLVREAATTIATGDPPERADAAIASLFATATREPWSAPGGAVDTPWNIAGQHAPGAVPPAPAVPQVTYPESDHRAAIALVVSGGIAVTVGIALWASYASLQGSIDRHPTATRADFDDLTALEDRAKTFSLVGNILVPVGLGAGALGAFYLAQNPGRRHVTVVAAPLAHGAGLLLAIAGGL
jgi:hypothetical protein